MLTQVSTALSLVVPGGAAVGIAGAYGILRRWGFRGRDIGRGVTLVSLWNQFANLSYPVVAVFLLAVEGSSSAVLATAAFIGAAVLGIAVAALGAVLASRRAAAAIGELAAQLADWALGKFGRGPVAWGGESFERFRLEAADLLRRRWHVLTLATYAGTLSVFLVFLVSLRAFDVPASEVTVIEAFAAWALARLLGTIPITPGGIGVVELSLTATLVGFGGSNAERRRGRARLPLPDDGADDRRRPRGYSILESARKERDSLRGSGALTLYALRSSRSHDERRRLARNSRGSPTIGGVREHDLEHALCCRLPVPRQSSGPCSSSSCG